MGKIRGLSREEKAEGKVYLWNFKTESHMNLLRANIRFIFEEMPNQYYITDEGKVVIADYITTSKERDIDNAVFDFVGYGKHIGSEDEKGNPDKRLLKFYKENPDKIPDFHKQIFETLTAPRRRGSE